MRIDVYLVEKGFCESRNKAARLIEAGKVLLDGVSVSKPSLDVSEGGHTVEITEKERFVGRGGLKLEAALEGFAVDVTGKKCIDVGASTGGFTDCLLQRRAAFVCAVDSGRGQLHPSLCEDERVSSVEGFNARELSAEDFGCFDIAVMDVSFISQTLIHGALAGVLRDGGEFISLIKPQFEAGKSALGKRGIVKSSRDRESAMLRVMESAEIYGLGVKGIMRSPIEGGDGNSEYLAYFVKGAEAYCDKEGLSKAIKELCRE